MNPFPVEGAKLHGDISTFNPELIAPLRAVYFSSVEVHAATNTPELQFQAALATAAQGPWLVDFELDKRSVFGDKNQSVSLVNLARAQLDHDIDRLQNPRQGPNPRVTVADIYSRQLELTRSILTSLRLRIGHGKEISERWDILYNENPSQLLQICVDNFLLAAIDYEQDALTEKSRLADRYGELALEFGKTIGKVERSGKFYPLSKLKNIDLPQAAIITAALRKALRSGSLGRIFR